MPQTGTVPLDYRMIIMEEDRFIPPGSRVRLDSLVDENDQPISEYGVVVHCWFEKEMRMFDCCVAFFGEKFPEGKPTGEIYLLQYASAALTVLPA